MAKIVHKGQETEVHVGDSIISACKEVGVLFGCHAGMCRTCEIEVIDGMEHLTDVTENEKLMEVTLPNRLACQCRIKKDGVITIRAVGG